jgi:hypothetical protein
MRIFFEMNGRGNYLIVPRFSQFLLTATLPFDLPFGRRKGCLNDGQRQSAFLQVPLCMSNADDLRRQTGPFSAKICFQVYHRELVGDISQRHRPVCLHAFTTDVTQSHIFGRTWSKFPSYPNALLLMF